MNQISINVTNGTQTMSSESIVDYLNATRDLSAGELTHKNFIVKIKKVLPDTHDSFESSVNFDGYQGQPRTKQVYNFPRREATLLAMSYSYKLQAAVYDAWTAAENLVKDVVKVLPVNYIEALELLVSSEKAKVVMSIKLEEAAPKVAFHDAVVADATVYSLGDAAKLLGIGRTKFAKWLRANSYVQQNLIPYATANKFLESSFSSFVLPNGTVKAPTTYVTGVGLKHFQRKLQTTD
jgi:phage antirepressor YoqD-like protein